MRLNNYTPEQAERLKDAVYKISDAYQMFKSLEEEMLENKQYSGQGDIARISHILDEQLIGEEGCLNPFLRVL